MDHKKKTLYISPNGFMGGAERIVYNTALGHSKTNYPVTYLFLNDGQCKESVEDLGIKTYLLPFKLKLKNIFSLIRTVKYVREIIRNESIEIIHATMPYAQIISYLSTIGLKIQKVWFQHGPVGGTLDKIANFTRADKILFNSCYLQSEHNKMLFSKRNLKIQEVINYGNLHPSVNLEASLEIRRKFIGDKKYLIATIGRLCNWKGQLNVLKSITKIRDTKATINFNYLIIGSANSDIDKVYENQLKEYCDRFDLNNHVQFISHVKNISDYMSAIHILIHSSSIPEPFGLVVSEAMLSKSLVIGSNKGGITDILKDGVTGFSYDSTSKDCIETLKVLLIRTLKKLDSDEIKRIRINGHNLITQKYNIEQMICQLETLYSN